MGPATTSKENATKESSGRVGCCIDNWVMGGFAAEGYAVGKDRISPKPLAECVLWTNPASFLGHVL